MRAVQANNTGAPDVLSVVDLATPEPGEGEVCLKVSYCGFNPMDAFARQGALTWMQLDFPFTPGIEHSGVVDAVGPGGDETLIGKTMLARNSYGGNADYSIVPVARLFPVPDGLDLKIATVFGSMTFTAYHLLHTTARTKSGDWCVFHSGAGPVGIMLTQVAKNLEAKVISLVGGNKKADFARPYGADHFVDYRDENWADEVMKITDGHGADLIVDGNQGPDAIRNYDAIAPNGMVVYIGATAGSPAPDVPTGLVITKSFFVGGFNLPVLDAALGSLRDNEAAIEKIRSGAWKVPISETIQLEDVPELHARFERRELKGRVIINVGGDA
jgi:NADPH2:quinone reductase